jgi:hypothetical protein
MTHLEAADAQVVSALWAGTLPVRLAGPARARSAPVKVARSRIAWLTLVSSKTSLYRDTFAIFGDETPLYSLQWIPCSTGVRRRRDRLSRMGEVGYLERLLARAAAR